MNINKITPIEQLLYITPIKMSDINKKMQINIPSLLEMQKFANLMALAINQSSLIVIFNGNLGAGKTTLIRFILQCFGCVDRINKSSQ